MRQQSDSRLCQCSLFDFSVFHTSLGSFSKCHLRFNEHWAEKSRWEALGPGVLWLLRYVNGVVHPGGVWYPSLWLVNTWLCPRCTPSFPVPSTRNASIAGCDSHLATGQVALLHSSPQHIVSLQLPLASSPARPSVATVFYLSTKEANDCLAE